MTINYEANLVVGCYISHIDIEETGSDDFVLEYSEDMYTQYGMIHSTCGFIGFKVDCEQRLTISSVQKLSKVAKKFRSITGQVAAIKACMHHILEEE